MNDYYSSECFIISKLFNSKLSLTQLKMLSFLILFPRQGGTKQI